MKAIFAFTLFVISVIATLLFIETVRLQYEFKKPQYGTLAYNINIGGGNV